MPMPSVMEYSDKGYDMTEKFEGCELVAYPDPGTKNDPVKKGKPWTIGFGHTKGVYEGMTCTREEAVQWLKEDIDDAEDDVRRLVKVAVTQGQYDALVDFVFNLGGSNFASSTLLRKLNAGDYKGADVEFSKWVLANGKKMKGLELRRLAESDLFDDEGPKFA